MREKIAFTFLLLSFAFSFTQAGEDQWLHVRVEDDGEKVSVNLPLDLIETVLAKVECDELQHGMISIDDQDFDKELLSAVVEAAKKSKDGNFIVIEGEDEQVRVRKQGDEILIDIDDDGEKVLVRIPIKVAEAMLGGDDDELDIVSGLRELSKQGGTTLVTVEGDGEKVRVWVNTSMEGI